MELFIYSSYFNNRNIHSGPNEEAMTQPIHEWEYLEKDHRKCKHCLMEEVDVEDDGGWTWLSTEDFMETHVMPCGL